MNKHLLNADLGYTARRKELQFYRADFPFCLHSDWMKGMCQNQSEVGVFIVFIICLV